MLSELHVEQLGVIEHLDLVLGAGLTVLTGETGAGKTLIIDAIDLLLGGRGTAELVRSQAAEARVDGRFLIGDHERVLSRVQPRRGRSRAYVDGRLATANQLGELGRDWVDLHGQHGQQSLLRRSVQRDALDRFAGIDVTPLREARARLVELDAELAALGGDARARAREIDLLDHQIDEITRANLDDPDEERHLDDEQDRLGDAVEHRRAGQTALAALRDDAGALDALSEATRALDGRRPFLGELERLRALLAELDDVVDSVRHQVEHIDEDPARLDAVVARRQQLRDLRRRYGDTLAEVVAFAQDAAARRDELASFDARAQHLDQLRQAAVDDLATVARHIGDARRGAAQQLGEAVTVQLRRLALPHATLIVSVGDALTDPAGDAVAVWFSANPGLDLQPLANVASGGELSRIMLALRLVLSGGPPTLIFDEVDAGIGGAAANAVADALCDVAKHRQVLVVTHLAQVAARADQHLVVDKRLVDGRTVTSVSGVDGDQRIAEIARMLSGSGTSVRARDHAAELLAARSASGIDTSGDRPG
jgi:DNA repair protein RecN (Recombination protein N)